jgi:uracil phosphoribosyltransferase
MPSKYYSKLPPNLAESYVLLIDPMLATGGSAAAAIDLIKEAGGRAIRMICIVAAPEGVDLLQQRHPDVSVYTPVIDRELNVQKFIVPGLGDFGDRLYGTM